MNNLSTHPPIVHQKGGKTIALAALMAMGTNIGLTKLADATPGISYHQMANLLHVEKSLDIRLPSIEEAKAKSWNDKEKEQMLENRKRMIIGGPKKVKSELLHLSERYHCNDWLILTIFMISKKNNSRIGEL